MRILAVLLFLLGGVLGILGALDDHWETEAELETPPRVYVSPTYIPPHAGILSAFALLGGALLVRKRPFADKLESSTAGDSGSTPTN